MYQKQYKKNFLKNVIIRMDFVSPNLTLREELPNELIKVALRFFPIDEPKSTFSQQVKISRSEISANEQSFTEWNFYGVDRNKRLMINPNTIFITYRVYGNYKKLRTEFLNITDVYFSLFNDSQPSRLGLRYINEIEIMENNPLDWDKYIDNRLLCLFKLQYENANPTRIFHNYEFKYNDFNIRYQFGINNPDYPAPIKRKVFVLDFDAYYQGLLEHQDVQKYINDYHNKIEELFEDSITDGLREVMSESRS